IHKPWKTQGFFDSLHRVLGIHVFGHSHPAVKTPIRRRYGLQPDPGSAGIVLGAQRREEHFLLNLAVPNDVDREGLAPHGGDNNFICGPVEYLALGVKIPALLVHYFQVYPALEAVGAPSAIGPRGTDDPGSYLIAF